jgi:hypothetical protein
VKGAQPAGMKREDNKPLSGASWDLEIVAALLKTGSLNVGGLRNILQNRDFCLIY